MRIVVPPAHGTAMVEWGCYSPNHPAANPRSACNARPQDGVGLFYRSAPGYRGPDLIQVAARPD